ncbi:MAG: alpha/beta hydrolase family esterase [Candidatus Binatia bacterium]
MPIRVLILWTVAALATVPRGVAAQPCPGDCDRDWQVAVTELMQGVDLLLHDASTAACANFDRDGDDRLVIADLLAAVGAALNGCPVRRGMFTITLDSGERERTALVTVPASVDPAQPVPLVLNFHGVNGTAAIIQVNTGLPAKAEQEGFITAAPQGIGNSWNAGVCCSEALALKIDDVGLTRDLIDRLVRDFPIDPTRIYATGFSNGGAMAYKLACDIPERFAAIAPVGGAVATFPCAAPAPVPLLVINNIDDPIVAFSLAAFSLNIWRPLNGCQNTPEVTQPAESTMCETYPCTGAFTQLCAVDGISHVWPGGLTNPDGLFDATDYIWDFFTQHQRPAE